MAELKVSKRSKNKLKGGKKDKENKNSNAKVDVDVVNENESTSDNDNELSSGNDHDDGQGVEDDVKGDITVEPSKSEVKLTKRERKKAKNREKLKLINAMKKQSKIVKIQEMKDESFVRNVKKLYGTLIKDDFAFIARAHHNHPRPPFDENGDRIYYNDECEIDDYAKSHLIDNDQSEKLKEKWEHGKPKTTRAKTHTELKARYNAKMEQFRQEKEGKGDGKKKKKKLKEKSDKKSNNKEKK